MRTKCSDCEPYANTQLMKLLKSNENHINNETNKTP